MDMIVKSVRNPYPVPDLSREGSWATGGPILDPNVCPNERRWYSKLKPHERLFSHHTLTSARKNHFYSCNKVPKDYLDSMLTSVYSHKDDLFVPKMYTTMQPESLYKETWRVLRNEIKVYSKPPVPLGHEIKYANIEATLAGDHPKPGWYFHKRRNVHPSSLQLAAEGPHTDRTNPGFSRKIDGTYYSI
ncbi:uncharacterized protein LOC106639653 [Copidosoma floridanum]|uniref:uncharacterized protein LOC106639653 n=1 Tax=Copidosoma floridanum TaxID=29053 RepID=UPI0006C96A03|nr:uncharacterized protein LOC106639653 [Copidosoma floridanum]